MIEDKLTHDERLRLECIAQAVAYVNMRPSGDVLALAKQFERYVKEQ